MLFQGQEFASSAPFLYFADHHPELAAAVRNGRREFLSQFPSLSGDAYAHVADPGDEATFMRCKLDHRERGSHAEASALHRSLLALRRRDAAFCDRDGFTVDGAVIGARSFVLRFTARDPVPDASSSADRLLLVNLGPEQWLSVVPEPLLSPYPAKRWSVQWASDDPAYGGLGMPPFTLAPGARMPAETAVVLAPEAAS
jgi:maltooligosyltrehalose trehalohydrolase